MPLTPPSVEDVEAPGLQKHSCVVVIGAGAAGLAAARGLHDSNIPTTVLEARDRAGGRMYTHTFPARPEFGLPQAEVDIGASIMHGCGDKNQYIFQMAAYCREIAPVVAGGHGYESTFYARWYDNETGDRISSETIVEMTALSERVCAKMKEMQEKEALEKEKVTKDGQEFKGMNVESAYNESLKYVLKKLNDRSLNRVEEQVLYKMFVRGFAYNAPLASIPLSIASFADGLSKIEDNNGNGLFSPSTLRREAKNHENMVKRCDRPKLTSASTRRAGDHILLGGYTQFLTRRLEEYLNIHRKAIVKTVRIKTKDKDLDSGHECEVECENGQVFPCTYVVCTLPIGVLRGESEKSKVTFVPPLSRKKQDAISKVSGGVHNKVVMRFADEDVFWPRDTPQINCADPRFQFFNLDAYGKTGVLLAHVFGASSFALEYDGLDDASVLKEVLKVLQGMFGHSSQQIHENGEVSLLTEKDNISQIPEPIDYIVTRWHMDPFSLGSYSVISLGGDWGSLEELSRPEFDGHLQFGGEHCSLAGWQCVHGAYESGVDCALRIMDALNIPQARRRGLCKKTVEEPYTEYESHDEEYVNNKMQDLKKLLNLKRVPNTGKHKGVRTRCFLPEEDVYVIRLSEERKWQTGGKFWSQQIAKAIIKQTGVWRRARRFYIRSLDLRNNPEVLKVAKQRILDSGLDPSAPLKLDSDSEGDASTELEFDERIANHSYIEEEVLEESHGFGGRSRTGRDGNETESETESEIDGPKVSRLALRWSKNETELLWRMACRLKSQARLIDFAKLREMWNHTAGVEKRTVGNLRNKYNEMLKHRKGKKQSRSLVPRKRSYMPSNAQMVIDEEEGIGKTSTGLEQRKKMTRENYAVQKPFEWTAQDERDLLEIKVQLAGPSVDQPLSIWKNIGEKWATTEQRQNISPRDLRDHYIELRNVVITPREAGEDQIKRKNYQVESSPWTLQEMGVLQKLTKLLGPDNWEDISAVWNSITFGTSERSLEDLQKKYTSLGDEDESTLMLMKFGELLVDPVYCDYDSLERDVGRVWDNRKIDTG
eukprot:Plantae.Rhodophyta-Hildenbrandia_rubra.ctg9002.p1 GENE.Plantae.Rhodophyta-Hildenbrandia_rubra.ctg9002~~Plantae.Rhodophyta-Hildenbrandia_rubra.ctg9002.p1  ORF type:complete len:1052 (-),score=206.07 Plantae.Rhodophyta-Hildenbrandia_rubra.ctg9002:892-4047(-)